LDIVYFSELNLFHITIIPILSTAVTRKAWACYTIIVTIFDILGLIGPVVVSAKIIMQKLWQYKIEWDDLLPTHLNGEWDSYL